MEDQKHELEFENALTSHLKNIKFDKKELSGLSRNMASAAKNGLKIIDWHIVGQPPAIEQIHFTGHIDPSRLAGLSKILADDYWKELIVFRKGIPFPDIFEVRVVADLKNVIR